MDHPFSSRRAGVLCHLSSIPSGTAERFFDFMTAAGLTIWQVLPLHPPDRHHSPYNGSSVFALNPSIAALGNGSGSEDEYQSFCDRNRHWLEDYALFEHACSGLGPDWRHWPEDVRRRTPKGVSRLRSEPEALALLQRRQFEAERCWQALKRQANERDILLFGDMPLYPAYESADVWTFPHLFALKPDLSEKWVAGVPPDYFSATGQLWGNPIYDWQVLEDEGFRWWIRRLERLLALFDVVRLDHFRGLSAYWAVPAGAADARSGAWRPGPGHKLLDALSSCANVALVAEDLGVIDEEVEKLRDDFALPGMRVLQFAFSGDRKNPHLPGRYPAHSVAYTGTHDNDTSAGWYAHLEGPTRVLVDKVIGSKGPAAWRMVQTVFGSAANTAMVPMQDLLGLGSEHRMNTPGTRHGNWQWQLDWSAVPDRLSGDVRRLIARTGRLAG
jgi:4-alpha-glucanotransferase